LFVLIPIVVFGFPKNKQQSATLKMSSLDGIQRFRIILTKTDVMCCRVLALCSLIIALARPRTVDISNKTKTTKGLILYVAIDVSGSMLAKDLKPNRMEALNGVAADFVQERPNDRIGLVVYASEAYTKNTSNQ
jgi:Ca-activated chloride channel family protein